jgi:hypothetical protein
MVGATLRVADDHIAAGEVAQHLRAHFAGIGAAFIRGHVLRAPGDGTVLQGIFALLQIRRRYAHGNRRLHTVDACRNALEQCGVGRAAAVHLPVAYDELGPHQNLTVK